MTSFYRMITNPDGQVTFVANLDKEEIADIEQIIGNKVYPNNKRKRYYEQTHYFKLINTQKIAKVKAYLAQNFIPPKVKLTIFRGEKALSKSLSPEQWQSEISQSITKQFDMHKYLVIKDKYTSSVYSEYDLTPCKIDPQYKFMIGVSFRIIVDNNFVPYICLDITHIIVDDMLKSIKIHDLLEVYPDSHEAIQKEYNHFTSHTTEYFFRIAKAFMKQFQDKNIQLPGNTTFSNIPMTAEELNYETWLWEHDYDIQLEVSNKNLINSSSDIAKNAKISVFQKPAYDILFIVIKPQVNNPNWHNPYWHEIPSKLNSLSCQFLGSAATIAMTTYSFDNMEKTIQSCENLAHKYNPQKLAIFLVVPPMVKNETTHPELAAWNKHTKKLNKKLRKQFSCYVAAIDWNKLLTNEREYLLESMFLKILTVHGTVPWRVRGMPLPSNVLPHQIAFIGIDLNLNLDKRNRKSVVTGCMFDGYGQLHAYIVIELRDPHGDLMRSGEQEKILKYLLEQFEAKQEVLPKHIVIHRDGFSHEIEVNYIDHLADTLNIPIDLVDIRKREQQHIFQCGNESGTPSRDVCIGSNEQGIAFSTNTFVNVTDDKLPAPSPIGIVRRSGNTHIKILAAQVFSLCLANYTYFRRSNKLPITIVYADALAARATPCEQQVTPSITLPWL